MVDQLVTRLGLGQLMGLMDFQKQLYKIKMGIQSLCSILTNTQSTLQIPQKPQQPEIKEAAVKMRLSAQSRWSLK